MVSDQLIDEQSVLVMEQKKNKNMETVFGCWMGLGVARLFDKQIKGSHN